MTQSAQFGAPPGCLGAGWPENRVQARSIPPQKKCTEVQALSVRTPSTDSKSRTTTHLARTTPARSADICARPWPTALDHLS